MSHYRRELRSRQPASRCRRLVTIGVAVVAGLVSASCGKEVDVKQALQVTDVTTGWFDAGVVDGKNKLVPSISFRLRSNTPDLTSVALNIAFKFVDNGEINEEIFKQRVPFENGQTELLTVRSQTGFTGEPPQTRADMLRNSNFRDIEAVILVRQTASHWVELHRVKLERQLLTN
jgi:hypothetical protein